MEALGQLVANEYAQKPGVHYEGTFLPVVHFLLRTSSLEHQMFIHQMDVVTAILHENLRKNLMT